MRLLSSFGIIAAFLYFAASAISQTCYMSDGSTTAPDDVPCNSDKTTTCCNKNDICMSNGLCYILQDGALTLSRGSCTDPFWGYPCSEARPCATTNPSSGYSIVNANIQTNTFCCGEVTGRSGLGATADDISCTVNEPFNLTQGGSPIPGVAGLAHLSSSTATPASTSTATATGGSSNDTSSDDDQSTRLAIGLGLGIPLGLIAGSALVWGGWERKRRMGVVREAEEMKATIAQNAAYAQAQAQSQVAPAELGQTRVVAELDSKKD